MLKGVSLKNICTILTVPKTGTIVERAIPNQVSVHFASGLEFPKSAQRAKLITFGKGVPLKKLGVDQALLTTTASGEKTLDLFSGENLKFSTELTDKGINMAREFIKFLKNMRILEIKKNTPTRVQLEELIAQGRTQKEIGEIWGRSATWVKKYMDEYGLKTLNPSQPREKIKDIWGNDALRKQIDELYFEGKMTFCEISKKLKVSITALSRYVNDIRVDKMLSLEDVRNVFKNENLTLNRMANRFRCAPTEMQRYLERHGLLD